MRDLLLLLVGVIVGGAMNLSVQLWLRHLDRRRALRLAARVVYSELMEFGYVEINSESGPFDASHVHAAWREHRAALIDLGDDTWSAVEHAVMATVYPELELSRAGQTHNSVLEYALFRLEPHAQLPEDRQAFTSS